MKGIWQMISAEPAVVTGAVMASVNVIAAFHVWVPTPEQLAAMNSALAAAFALVVRAVVEPRHGRPVRVRQARPRQPQKRVAQPGATMDQPGVTATHSPGSRVPAGPGL